jgi:hypothetical protein
MKPTNDPVLNSGLSDREKESSNHLVFSYLTLRNLIGISGILLPIILYFTTRRGEVDKRIEPSISDYYYSSNGDVLVVLLSVLGVFLFTYKGYTWKEKTLTNIAAICAIGIGFTPTSTSSANSLSIHIANSTGPEWFGVPKHFIFAALFFASVAIMSLVFFPKTDSTLKPIDGKKTQKAKRNGIFRFCGWTILACLLSLFLYFIFTPAFIGDFPIIFVLETVAIWAFGVSWLTKGETLWPDGEHYIKRAAQEVKDTLTGKQAA